MRSIDEDIKRIIIGFQKNEITEHYVYKNLTGSERSKKNSD